VIDQNRFFRAGSFGIDLENANKPQITNNGFVCNGSGSPTPVTTCTANGTLQKFSAIYLENVTADLLPNPPATVPPAPPALATSGVSNNVGQQNGLDAVVVSGRITSDVAWKTPTNDPNGPDLHAPHDLGYMVANVAGTGGLELLGKTLTVGDGDVVKVMGGGITLTGGALQAGSSGLKSFTSMRDNGVGIQACPSVFVQTCLATVPSNEWIGIDLSGATGRINNANILFPTKGVTASGAPASVAAPDGHAYGLVVTGSRIGPTFSDSVATSGTAVYVASSSFCRIDANVLKPDGITPNPNYNACIGAGPGDHGINADFSGVAGNTALTLLNNTIQGSTNEGILGTDLGLAVDIEGNSIDKAGAYGLRLAGANNPTVTGNVITRSGTSTTTPPSPPTTTYPAIYLAGLSNANFQKFTMPLPTPIPSCHCIEWNTGSGNGLNAIAFDGSTTDLNWMSPANGNAIAALGYLLVDNTVVNGTLTLNQNDLLEIRQGSIKVTGQLKATGATVTSLKEGATNFQTCGSVFTPRASGACQPPVPGDWTGFILNGQETNALTNSNLRYATIGIRIDKPVSQTLILEQTNIDEVADSGIHSEADLKVTGGHFSNSRASTGNGIWFDRGANISGVTEISNTGQEGILGIGLNTDPIAGFPVVITGTAVQGAGTYGIRLTPAGPALAGAGLTITRNVVTNSGTGGSPYPAIYLNGVSAGILLYPGEVAAPASLVWIRDNTGKGNGLDALVFHGSVARNLTWLTAYKNQPAQRLGYLLDGDLDMNGHMLTVNAGDVVKVGNGGTINMNGGRLQADGTSTSSQKIFTTLADNSAGVAACPSVFLSPGCSAANSYWKGLSLPAKPPVSPSTTPLLSDGTLVNAAIRYAKTGISISSGATSTFASSVYGLVVERSAIGPIQVDGINSTATAISVTNSTVNGNGGVHGVTADLTAAPSGTALRFSGNRFMSTGAEAILGQALAGQPVWITDNQIQHAGTFGIRLLNADELVLRNNNISTSGTGPIGYPAAYLAGVTANFSTDVRGNVGQGNGINAIVIDGQANGDMTWTTPPSTNTPTTKPLGYMLDGGLLVQGGTLTVRSTDVVKGLGGVITISGGTLNAGDAGAKTFTSVKDPTGYTSCPSFFALQCVPNKGDWGGLVLTSNAAHVKGSGTIDNGLISYASTGISIDSGPIAAGESGLNFRLTIRGNTNISNGSKDGINAFDTPISVTDSTIANVDGQGIVASFFSPANCALSPAPCSRLTITGTHVNSAGKDGILANGLGGEPIFVTGNTVDHAGNYGIRLVGADQLTLTDNSVTNSGGVGTAFRYPAMYLNGVKANFALASAALTVAGNHGSNNGLDVIAFHGEATSPLTWLTTGLALPPTAADHLGYMLDGALTVDGDFTTNKDDAVKVFGGAIKVNGGLHSIGTIFTSLRDGAVPIAVCAPAFDSIFLQKVGGVCQAPQNSDWNGINIDALDSTFKTGKLFYASSGLKIANAKLDVSHATLRGISGTALASTGTQALTVECSNITGNGTGVAADYGTVAESDVYNNSVADLAGNANLVANNDWLGSPRKTTTATVNGALAAQRPVMTLTLSSDNPLTKLDQFGNRAFGVGNLTLVAQSNRQMDQTVLPSGQFSLTTGPASTFSFNVTGLPNNGYATDHKWMPNPYLLDDIASITQAGENTVRVTGARDCVPAEVGNADSSLDHPDSNLMTDASQAFSASVHHTTLTASGASGDYGGTATLAAHLTALGQPAAGQKISFTLNGSAAGTATTNGIGDASTSASLAGINAGSYPTGVHASFAGDPDQFFTPAPAATGAPITAALTVNRAGTATALSSTKNPSTYGDSVTLTATVTTLVSGGVDPKGEGSVTFKDGVTPICTNAPLGATTNIATCTRTDLIAAVHSITATYNPASLNPNFTTSTTSSALSQTVNKATPTLATSPSASGGGLGTYVNDSVTVGGSPAPGGTVTFQLYAPGDPTCTSTNLVNGNPAFANISLTNGAAGSPSYQATTAGDYRWIVNYAGDANHNPVAGSCGDKVTITSDLATTTTLASQPTNATSSSSVSLTATVTPTWTTQANPTGGTVAFAAGASVITCDAGSTTGLALTTTSNAVTCITDYATVNGKKVTATYSGNTSGGTTYDGSTRSLLGSTTTVTSSGPSGIASGASVTLTATLNPTAAGGTIEFFDGSSAIGGCTSVAVSGGAASCTTSSLTGSGTTHTITAIYSGNSSYVTSEGTYSQTIN
jgi:hypothetical protein